MGKCNHSEVLTNFCPDCGADLTAGPLGTLLSYLKQQLKEKEKKVGKYKHFVKRDEAEGDNKSFWRLSVENSEAVAAKWRGWVEEIQKIIDEKKGKI